MKPFRFKQFTVHQDKAAMKIGTDAVLLGAWCEIDDDVDSILDIGSGTGVIALMLAQRSDAMTVDAVEIEDNAYEQTVENFEQSDWADRLFCYHATFQEFAKELSEEEEEYDLIVSNPPFYTDTFETKNKARNKARFTTSLSFEDLLIGVIAILSKEGKFAVILPFKEKDNFVAMAKEKNLYLNRICLVQGNPNSPISRCLLEFSFSETLIKEEKLVIEIERHQYTTSYKELTSKFYL